MKNILHFYKSFNYLSTQLILFSGLVFLFISCSKFSPDAYHVWEKVEITLKAENKYDNP